MKKRVVILFLALIMMLSSCSVFNKQENSDETENTIQGETITFGFIGLLPATEDETAVSSRIHQKILEDFGIDIQVVTLDEDTWSEQLDDLITQDALPDVFFHSITGDLLQYRQLIDLGMVRDIPKSMWSKRDNLARVMSWYEDIYSVDGKMFFVPRTYQTFDQTHGSSYAILHRRDWAYIVDEIPPEEPHYYNVMDMMKKFVAQDPDSNDVKDTWGITGGDGLDFLKHAFFEPFGVREWMYENGEWVPGMLSEKAKAAAAWISELYKEGVIDPDFTNQTSEDALNKFITGKSGACLVSIYPEQVKRLEETWLIYNSTAISQAVDIVPLYFAPDGYRYNEVETFSTGTMFSSDLTDAEMGKVLDLIDWMYSDEGRMYLEYGEEGTDYLYVFNEILATNENEEDTSFFGEKNTEYKALAQLASWNYDFADYYESSKTEFQAYAVNVLEYDIWAYSYQDELFTNGMITPEICILNIDEVARDMLFEVIMISSDFDESWNEYVDYCYTTFNVDKAAEEIAKRAQEMGITPEQ